MTRLRNPENDPKYLSFRDIDISMEELISIEELPRSWEVYLGILAMAAGGLDPLLVSGHVVMGKQIESAMRNLLPEWLGGRLTGAEAQEAVQIFSACGKEVFGLCFVEEVKSRMPNLQLRKEGV